MIRTDDPRIPPIGAVSQSERLFRVNWVTQELRAPSGAALLPPEFVAQQGRRIKIVDLREEDELRGPLGHIPGCEWIARAQCREIAAFDPDAPFVLVSRGGERAAAAVLELEAAGMRFTAAMMGGIVAWKQLGFSTVRDSTVLAARGLLRPYSVPVPRSGHLDRRSILAHIGDPTAVRWLRLAALLLHGRLSCVDGRDDAGVIGTPGGDAGELVLALAAAEQVTNRQLAPPEIDQIFAQRLDAFGRFYVHSDVHASNALIQTLRADPHIAPTLPTVGTPLEWRKFMFDPPPEARAPLLAYLMEPKHMGCGHLRLMVQHPERYGVRAELVRAVLAAFLRAHWAGSSETEYVVLGGGHQEGAVVDIRLDEEVWPFSRIPLVSPQCEGTQFFVMHSQVVAHLRRQLAELIGRALGLAAGQRPAIAERMSELGARQGQATLSQLAAGLPVYQVHFGPAGVRVVDAGQV